MQNVIEFVDGEYFSNAESTLSVSTVDGYRKLWRAYRDHFEGLTLDLLTYQCQGILRTIVRQNPHLTKTTVRHIKNFFSGVWAHAIRMGVATLGNPWRDVRAPLAQEPTETHAYSPEEIDAMLSELSGQTRLVVLLAACTGLRKSEIRGLTWGDWKSGAKVLEVRRAMWRRYLKDTKSKASKAPVPVVPVLAAALDKHLERLVIESGLTRAESDFIFTTSAGTSLDLDNLARRVITPAIGGHAKWYGWHAFRRGLATYLHAHGVDDKTIQAILRHENVATTQKSYIKTIPESVRNAMAAVNFGSGQ
jgi:integrase